MSESKIYFKHVRKLNKDQKLARLLKNQYIPNIKHDFTMAAQLVGRDLRVGVTFTRKGKQKDSYCKADGRNEAVDRLHNHFVVITFEGSDAIDGSAINQSLNALAAQIDADPVNFRLGYDLAAVTSVPTGKIDGEGVPIEHIKLIKPTPNNEQTVFPLAYSYVDVFSK